MNARKEHRPEPGSLEASLRELSMPSPQPVVPDHAEDPTTLRPGEHTAASPRTFEAAGQGRPGYTLWGRCGYVPSARVHEESR